MTFLLWHGFRDSAVAHPERAAVEWRGEVLTYHELDELSNALAALLVDAGIGPGHRVGLYAPKTHLSLVAMLGISKAGAAYVPIDPHAPPLRAAYILGNCAVSAVVTDGERLHALAEHVSTLPSLHLAIAAGTEATGALLPEWVRTVPWQDLAPCGPRTWPAAVECDPAYLLYTSGSTGHPKGVIITHRNALTFIDWGMDTFGVGPADRLSSHAPLHFDLSVFDVYCALGRGATVVLVPDQVAPFPRQLARWIRDQRISVWYSVPSALVRMLLHGQLDQVSYPELRIVLFAGEVFPTRYLRDVMRIMAASDFYNLYGPTETNVCTYWRVPRDLAADVTTIPIGAACANTQAFAVDDAGTPVTVGEEGELLVRGGTVMAGYWGLPERTAQSLVSNPLQPAFADRAYRTGDLVRLQADGTYAFLGRRDHMVKSRGYRIELGEVEQVLYQHTGIREAAVIPVPDDEVGARLRAVVSIHAGAALATGELQAHCLRHLPQYMVPESFSVLDELPKTSTGKTDRQSLLALVQKGTGK